ncbi:DNA-3-methyladenine glycosylase [Pedobacter sp.]|nr:DNA-3-methyladenine glycosylase [Candidatus Saccharibacteria bacterium]
MKNLNKTRTLAAIVALPAPEAAPLLLGNIIVSHHGGVKVEGIISEVEAYTEEDPASHTYGGPTKRNAVMFEDPGRAYVYFTYGMHFCLNIVCGYPGRGEAVLIRAIEITEGLSVAMARRYGDVTPTPLQLKNLSNGPAKVTKILGIGMADYGKNLLDERNEVYIRLPEPSDLRAIQQTARIGISRAKEVLWRWHL